MRLVRTIWFILAVLMVNHAFAGEVDTIKIDKDGIVTLPTNFRLTSRSISKVVIDSSELVEWNRQEIMRAERAISDNIKDALRFFNDTNESQNEIILYKQLWGNNAVNILTQNLDFIRETINLRLERRQPEIFNGFVTTSGPFREYGSQNNANSRHYIPEITDQYKILKECLYQLDRSVNFSIHTKQQDGNYQINVYKLDPYRQFLFNYYRRLMDEQENAIVKENANLKSLLILSKSVLNKSNQLKSSLSTLNTNEFNMNQVDTLYRVYSSNSLLETYLQAPWFRQWFWKTAGRINTIPLGFTDDELLRLPPSKFDSADYKKYITFLDSSNSKFLIDKNARDACAFKTAVIDQYHKDDLFVNNAEIQKLKSLNRELRTRFLSYRTQSLTLTLPIAEGLKSPACLYFSAADRLRNLQNLRPITLDDRVMVVVYNILKDDSVLFVKTSSLPITDESQFTSGLNTATNFLAQTLALPITSSIPGVLNMGNMSLGRTLMLPNVANAGAIPNTIQLRIREFVEGLNTIESLREFVERFNGRYFLFRQPFDVSFVEEQFEKTPSISSAEMIRRYWQRRIFPYITNEVKNRISILDTLSKEFLLASAPFSEFPVTAANGPELYSQHFFTEPADSTSLIKYNVSLTKKREDKRDTFTIASLKYKTGKRYWIQASIGLTYTFQPVRQNEVTNENGKLTINSKNEQYGVAAAVHFYPINGGIFLQDRKFFGEGCRNVLSRMNIMAGVDFRNVPNNIYLGVGYDFGPGIRVNTGVHLYKYTQYEIRNDVVLSEGVIYKAATPFIYLGIDPVSFVKALNIFGNK